MAGMSMMKALPKGFRLNAKDEILVNHYLRRKLENVPEVCCLIPELNIYQWDPMDLIRMYNESIMSNGLECFFFCPANKTLNGNRNMRRVAGGQGRWCETGRGRQPQDTDTLKWGKKIFFYKKNGKKTGYVMHEFRIVSDERFVLCRITKKPKKQSKKVDSASAVVESSTIGIVGSNNDNGSPQEASTDASIDMPMDAVIPSPPSDISISDYGLSSPQCQFPIEKRTEPSIGLPVDAVIPSPSDISVSDYGLSSPQCQVPIEKRTEPSIGMPVDAVIPSPSGISVSDYGLSSTQWEVPFEKRTYYTGNACSDFMQFPAFDIPPEPQRHEYLRLEQSPYSENTSGNGHGQQFHMPPYPLNITNVAGETSLDVSPSPEISMNPKTLTQYTNSPTPIPRPAPVNSQTPTPQASLSISSPNSSSSSVIDYDQESSEYTKELQTPAVPRNVSVISPFSSQCFYQESPLSTTDWRLPTPQPSPNHNIFPPQQFQVPSGRELLFLSDTPFDGNSSGILTLPCYPNCGFGPRSPNIAADSVNCYSQATDLEAQLQSQLPDVNVSDYLVDYDTANPLLKQMQMEEISSFRNNINTLMNPEWHIPELWV